MIRMMNKMSLMFLASLSLVLAGACQDEKQLPLKDTLSDELPSERWIYDDWDRGRKLAQEKKRPLMVVFRCVP